MGEVFTSYYNKAKALERNRWEFVQISNSKPTWWEYPTIRLDALVPPWYIVDNYKNGSITWEEYTEQYDKYLMNEDVEDAIGTIEKLAVNKNVVLLCWENPESPCHRHILANFMNRIGFDIKELELK